MNRGRDSAMLPICEAFFLPPKLPSLGSVQAHVVPPSSRSNLKRTLDFRKGLRLRVFGLENMAGDGVLYIYVERSTMFHG